MRNIRERIERGESAVSDQTLPTVNIITYYAPETAPVLLDVFKQCAKQDTYSDHARMCGCCIISYLLCISSWTISYFSNDCDQIPDKPQLKKRRVYFGSQFAGGSFPLGKMETLFWGLAGVWYQVLLFWQWVKYQDSFLQLRWLTVTRTKTNTLWEGLT